MYVFLEDEQSLQTFKEDLNCYSVTDILTPGLLQKNYAIFNSIKELLEDAKESLEWVLRFCNGHFYVLEFNGSTGEVKHVDKYYIDIAFRKS